MWLSIARTRPSAVRRFTWPRSFDFHWPVAFHRPRLAQHGRPLLTVLHRLIGRWLRLTLAVVAAAVTAVVATSVAAPSALAQPAKATLHHAVRPHQQKPASQTRPHPNHQHHHQQHQSAPAKPYYIYDSVTPKDIPAEHHTVATYINGRYKASQSDVAGRHKVLWIDTTGGDPSAADVLDVEPGDATPATAAHWAYQRLHHDPNAQCCVYTMRSLWPATRAAIHHQLPSGMGDHVRWWIADPTGHPHVVPGSDATQWYWSRYLDISTANPGF
ncbi:MAG TPA: hypothetical protein VHZ03_54790 [Trebonia sp.]|nr:hypothetical protein [Trebonia sp.]